MSDPKDSKYYKDGAISHRVHDATPEHLEQMTELSIGFHQVYTGPMMMQMMDLLMTGKYDFKTVFSAVLSATATDLTAMIMHAASGGRHTEENLKDLIVQKMLADTTQGIEEVFTRLAKEYAEYTTSKN